MLTSVVGPLPVCRIMIVSVSSEVSSPVASSAFCSSVRLLRLSEPTISQLVPADATPPAGSGHPGQGGVDVHPERGHQQQQGEQDPPDPEPAEAGARGRRGRAGRDGAERATVGRWPGAAAGPAGSRSGGMTAVSFGRGGIGRGGGTGGDRRGPGGAGPGCGRAPGPASGGRGRRGRRGVRPAAARRTAAEPVRNRDGAAGHRPAAVRCPAGRRGRGCRSSAHQFRRRCSVRRLQRRRPTSGARTGFGFGGLNPAQESSGSPSNRPSSSA